MLPPPLDVVVGLRQVHFLAKFWADVRGEQLRVVVDGALEPGWTAGAREFGEFDQQGGK